MSSLGLETLVKVAVHHDRCEQIQELSENVGKLKGLMKQNLGKSLFKLNHGSSGLSETGNNVVKCSVQPSRYQNTPHHRVNTTVSD